MRIALTLGVSTREELVGSLRSRGVRTNAYFEALFPHVVVEDAPRSLTLVIASAASLGLASGTTLDALVAHAAGQGLAPCPLEAALRLRLALSGEPLGERVTVVSPRVVDDETFPRGFYVRRDEAGPWLRGFVASDDWIFDASERFALAARA